MCPSLPPPTTPDEARARGLRRYSTGVPCSRGHLAERHVSGGCVECLRERQRKRVEGVPERLAAFERGLKRYSTGVPCVHGHLAERHVANGACVECQALRQRAFQDADPGRAASYARAWAAANPERRRAVKRAWREANRERANAYLRAWRAARRARSAAGDA